MNDAWVSSAMSIIGTQIATYLAACHVRLFVNSITWNANIVIGSLTEASFAGYTAQAVATPAPPVNDPTNGGVSTFLPSNVFAASGTVTPPQTVYGWYMTDTGGNLMCGGNLPNPITVAGLGDAVPLQSTLNYPA